MDTQLPTGSETLLVVEDEVAIRKLTVRILDALGYRTLEAANGTEAIGICRDHAESIDLVMTDMMMPNGGGRQFVEELHRAGKETKVLFVSGYGTQELCELELPEGAPQPDFLQKPFTRDILARKVREVLDR